MSSPDADPCEAWLDDVIDRFLSALHNPQVIGDDETGWMTSVEGPLPAHMAQDFLSVIKPEDMAMLLAYAVRRCAILQMDKEVADD